MARERNNTLSILREERRIIKDFLIVSFFKKGNEWPGRRLPP